MKLKLTAGQPVSEEVISAFEAALGCRISQPYRDFVRAHDGAKPETNTFRIDDTNDSGINRFIPINRILKERELIETLQDKMYPIAWAEGGNYVCIDEASGGDVFFWDHEEPGKVAALAASFEDFLDLLEPFDVSKIELKPGQVKAGCRPGMGLAN